jgi:hypothetical protein
MLTVNDVRRIGGTLESFGIKYRFDASSKTFTTFSWNKEIVKNIFKNVYGDIYKKGEFGVIMMMPINAPLAL